MRQNVLTTTERHTASPAAFFFVVRNIWNNFSCVFRNKLKPEGSSFQSQVSFQRSSLKGSWEIETLCCAAPLPHQNCQLNTVDFRLKEQFINI